MQRVPILFVFGRQPRSRDAGPPLAGHFHDTPPSEPTTLIFPKIKHLPAEVECRGGVGFCRCSSGDHEFQEGIGKEEDQDDQKDIDGQGFDHS